MVNFRKRFNYFLLSGSLFILIFGSLFWLMSQVTSAQEATQEVVEGGGSSPTFDLQITKAVTPTYGPPGTAVTYTIVISNNGPQEATDFLITDTLPSELIMTHIDTGGSFFTETITPTLSWSYLSLDPGEQDSLTIAGIISPSVINETTLMNTAFISHRPLSVLGSCSVQVI